MMNNTSYPKLLVFLAATFLLFGCSEENVTTDGGGTTTGTGTGTGTGTTPTTATLSLGSGSGSSFTSGALEIKTPTVTAFGSIPVSAFIVDANNNLSTAANSVTFTSHCAIQGLAGFGTTANVSTTTGIATAIYTDAGCQVSDTIIAIADWDTFLTASGDVTIDTSSTVPTPTLRIGSGLPFTDGTIQLATPSIPADGSTLVTVNLIDSNNNAILTNKEVTFTSDCVNLNAASFSPSPVTNITGTVSSTYTAAGCVGSDVITVSVFDLADNTTKTATGTVTIAAAAAGSIQFSSASASLIALQGTGTTTGLPENSTITFTVLDANNSPLPNESVTFSLTNTTGGIALSNTTAISDANGIVTTTLQSGTTTTSARVSVSVDSNPTLVTNSNSITIATGPPAQAGMTLSAETLNPRAWNLNGQTVKITASLGDRNQNNVQDGTAILFRTELGGIEASCTTVDTSCSVLWTSKDPRGSTANAGRSTIIATVVGEESFVDVDSNGVFSDGDTFTDIPEAYIDENENGVYDSGEWFNDFNNSGDWTDVNGKYNGAGCTHSTLCDTNSSVIVNASTVIVMAEDTPGIYAMGTNGTSNNLCNSLASCDAYRSSGTILGTNFVSNISVTFGGVTNGETLPAGTIIDITSNNGEINGGGGATQTIPNTYGLYTMLFSIGADTTPSTGSISAKITIGDGGGIFNLPIVGIDDTGTAVAPSTILLGTGSGVGFNNGVLDITATTLAAGSPTTVSVNVVDSLTTALITDPTTITFSSTCASSGDASFSNPTIATITGTATTTYTPSSGCVIGVDQITATSGTATATGTVTVTIPPPPAPVPASIQFDSASASLIALKGTGSTTGLPENSTIAFTVLDNSGSPIANESVTFSLSSAIGGITLSSLTAISDANGLVTTVIQSGTVATSTSVTVVVDSNPALTTSSSSVAIATGPADQDSMSLSVSTLNPRAWSNTTHTATVTVTAHLSDRFNNPIQDGTAISFRTELGSIQSSCLTVDGSCSVNWTNTNPLGSAANAGRTTILATAIGEESFFDTNANGQYDSGEPFDDLGEAFLDADESGAWNIGESFVDFDNSGGTNPTPVDGTYNGSSCASGCSATSSINVRSSIVLVLAEDVPTVLAMGINGVTDDLCSPTTIPCDTYLATIPVIGTNIASSILVTLGGIDNAQALPSGTDVSFNTVNGEILAGANGAIGNTTSTSTFYLLLAPDTTPSYNSVTDFLSVDINIGDGGSPYSLRLVNIDDTGSAVAPSTILLGTGEAGTFVDGALEILPTTSLPSGGSTPVTVNVVNSITKLKETTNNTVTFSSPCATAGSASFDNPSVITATGTVTVNYTASTCSGIDVITATSGSATASANVDIASATAGSIQFTSSSASLIALQGTGNTSGLPETSNITFTVVTGAGVPMANALVDFTLDSTVGGILLISSSGQTDSAGKVVATIQSGTVATSVRVTAQVTSVPALITTSSAIVIATGPPDQDSLSLSASVLNPRGWDLDGTDVTLTARLADRFNNKIQDGTAISFMTELGSIVGSCTTVNGACSTTWTSQAPRIVATDLSGLGRTTIIATVEGEESFIDVDGDGVYSDADTGLFTDLPEAYRDDNEDGAFNSGETFIDFDGSLSWNDVSTMYNGSGCTNTTVGAGGCDPVDSITVRDSIVLVMAEDQPAITAIGTNGSTNNLCATQAECLVTTGGYPGRYPGSLSLVLGGAPDGAVGSVTFTIAGINNEQVLPAGSTINFGVTNGKITGGASHTVTSTNANPATGSGVTRYTVYLKADTTPSNDGVLNISANVAGSTWSFPPIDIDDSAAPAVEYFVSGNITGTAFPASTSLNLLNNGGDAISVPASGAAFAFPTGLLDGDNYAVTVVNNTTGLTCVVTGGSSANGSGSIAAADVTNIDVACN